MNLQFVAQPDRLSAFRPPIIIPGPNSISISGLGDDPTLTQQIQSSILSGAQVGASAAMTSGSKVVGAIAGGLIAMAPIPVVGPILAAIGALVGPIATLFKGCGQTCIEATRIADQAGAMLNQLKDYYWAQPVHYASVQAATLHSIEEVVQYINQACSNPALGPAGQRCISERTVRGGTAPWCTPAVADTATADHRGCDIWTAIYDPIAHDPDVVPDPVQAQTQSGVPVAAVLSNAGIGISGDGLTLPMPLVLGGAALLLLLAISGDN